MNKRKVKYDRDWGWKYDDNRATHGTAFAVDRALKAGATAREIAIRHAKLMQPVQQANR